MNGGNMKIWLDNKNTRAEMALSVPGMAGKKMASLVLAAHPGKVYMLDIEAKTYTESENKTDPASQQDRTEDYEFVVVGAEKVNGYNATHVQARSKKSNAVLDWWFSKEVKGYEQMTSLKTREMDSSFWIKGLQGKEVAGFPVRMTVNRDGDGRTTMQMDLVKAENQTVPASMFSLNGYTKTEGNPLLPGGLDPEKIKNMTPDERQKWMEEMMKKYQK